MQEHCEEKANKICLPIKFCTESSFGLSYTYLEISFDSSPRIVKNPKPGRGLSAVGRKKSI